MKLVSAFAMVSGQYGPERRTVLAESIGPFVIYSDGDINGRKHCRAIDVYHVTHRATGYSAAKSRSKKHAAQLARKLIACGADWSFCEPDAVKAWPLDLVKAVRAIRSEGV